MACPCVLLHGASEGGTERQGYRKRTWALEITARLATGAAAVRAEAPNIVRV